MPIYEYICEDCGNCFETIVFQSESEKSPDCPECGKNNTKKQLSSFSCGSGGIGDSLSSGCNTSGGFS